MQNEAHMIWNLTLLVVHLLALAGFVFLYKAAPCWMQKVCIVGFCIAMAVCSIGFGFGVAGQWWHWHIVMLGLAIEHVAVLLYVFRLIYQDHVKWTPSSAPYRSS